MHADDSSDIRQRSFLTGDGVELAVHEQVGDGQPVLFQHGLGGDQWQCDEAFPRSNLWRRVTVECRGHGASAPGEVSAISIERYAEDIIQFIESELPVPVVIGGISMGAVLSLRIALTRPELVRGLILARPAWALESAPENMRPNVRVGELLIDHSPADAESLFTRTETFRMLQAVAPDNLASLMSFFRKPDARQFGHILARISNDGPGIDPAMLRGFDTPTLVLATGEDHIHPLHLAESLATHLHAGPVVQLTPKQRDKSAYVQEFRLALDEFLNRLMTS